MAKKSPQRENTDRARAKEFLLKQDPIFLQLGKLQRVNHDLKRELDASLEREAAARSQVENLISLVSAPEVLPPIKPVKSSNVEEAVAVAVASDWHVEEQVNSLKIGGRNEYNLDVAKKRSESFFRGVEWLIKLHREGPAAYKIDTLVLAVIGDLITGYIHEDLRQSNFLSPTRASLFARDLLRNGIDYLLKYSGIKNIIIPCMH